tara:strand:- start:4481 stop:6079 length:1599 start_codon:yes stop_codon:yes gene_type:complete
MSEKATLLSSIPPVKTTESNDGRQSLLAPMPVLSNVESTTEAKMKVEDPSQSYSQPYSQSYSSSGNDAAENEAVTAAPALMKIEPIKATGKVSLLSQTREAPPVPVRTPAKEVELAKPVASSSSTTSTATAASTTSTASTKPASSALLKPVELEPSPEPASVTGFQMVTYASFVLNFLLAGAVAVILYKKAMKLAEERFVVSAKAMAIAGVLIMLHGFFATYLYAAHLNDSVSTAPLFLTMGVWILVGPAVGIITRHLLARGDKPNMKAGMVDAAVYGLIFFLTACGVSSGIKTNAALLASILAGFLMIVPIARSLTAFERAKARHQELNETSDKILIYGLLLLPALLPVLAFANVCGLSDALTLFLINFITFDFVLVVSLSLMASADEFMPAQESGQAAASVAADAAPEAVEVAESREAVAAVAAADPEPMQEVPAPVPAARPEKLKTGNPDDPIIQFLNGEVDEEEAPLNFDKPSSVAKPASSRPLPPRKPGHPGIKPPKKPGTSSAAKAPKAPNAPSRLKAPAKPKKRF